MVSRDLSDHLNRRSVLGGASALGAISLLAACDRKDIHLQKLWKQWLIDWHAMETIAKSHGWELELPRIAAPAPAAKIALIEKRHGLSVPPQLKAVLTELSARVVFGWHVPSHQRPMERVEHLYPTRGGIRGFIWNLDHIDEHAIPNFLGWKRDLATRDLSEAKNTPEMWNNQFPIADLPNGDLLTIDTSSADPTQQPVRYFSHELEGLHAHALAPNFFSFITAYSALGCAGNTHDDWFRFIDNMNADTRVAYLNASGEGAKRWLTWRDTPNALRHPDYPPPAVVETTAADRALLDAARLNSLSGVNAALLAGAKPDCVPNSDWQQNFGHWTEEFFTAITYATRHNNTKMIERLLKAGATLNTRHLPLNEAVKQSSLATVQWLIANGARVNGWKDQRYWPLHDLVVTRGAIAQKNREEYRKELIDQAQFGDGSFFDDLIANATDEAAREAYREAKRAMAEQTRKLLAEVDRRLEVHTDVQTYLKMVEALLAAGANPDAPWDNGITMLAWGGVMTGKILLAYGADPNVRDVHGITPLHYANTAEKVRLLVSAGADINAVATPPKGDAAAPYTPLQAAFSRSGVGSNGVAETLLDVGADPKRTDGHGRSTLAYCLQEEAFRLIMSKGLDPLALEPGRRTLLHNLMAQGSVPRHQFPREVAFFKFLLGLGIDINALDEQGQTMLHIAAEREGYDENSPNYEILIAAGADKAIKDKNGKRAYDLLAKSLKRVRAVLK